MSIGVMIVTLYLGLQAAAGKMKVNMVTGLLDGDVNVNSPHGR